MAAKFPRYLVLSFSLLWLSTSTTPAFGQQGPQILEGLLKDLLRSQVERNYAPPEERHPLLVPGKRSEQQVAPNRVPDVVLRAGRMYGSLANESQRLARLLRQDARTTAGIKGQLDKVLMIQARAQLLSEKFTTPQKEDFILDNMRALDRDWRTTAYRLNNLRGLSDPCRRAIQRIDAINQQCCGLLNLEPQINRRELIRLADALAAEIHHLERDVEYEVRSNPRARQIVMRLRRLEARAKLFSDSVANRDNLEIVVAEYQQFISEWRAVEQELMTFNDRHIDRTVEQIHEVTRAIQDQLRIPVSVDRAHIKHLAHSAQQRIKALGDSFSLSMLSELPDPVSVVHAAKALNAETTHLCNEVDTGSDDHLFEHWSELNKAWAAFDQHTANIDSPRIRSLRGEISDHIEAMRQGLGIELIFDRREVIRAVAELEGIAEQAQYHIGQWQRRPGSSLDATLITSAKSLIGDIHHLHEECAGKASREHLARDCNKLAQRWSSLRPQLMQCRTIDQHALHRISDDATAKLIHLQTLLDP